VAFLAARASELQAAALAILGGVAMIAAGPVLGRMLPAYRPGVEPALWLVPGAVALGLALPASQYLVAVCRERRALAALVVATAAAAVGNHVALTWGYGLVGVAISTSLSYLVSYVMLVAISIWPELDRPARMRYVAVMLLTMVPTLASALWLESRFPSDTAGIIETAAKLALVLVVWSVTLFAGWRWGGWKAAWREEKIHVV
jgi:O-antigen/teichoic acid export membrane protein